MLREIVLLGGQRGTKTGCSEKLSLPHHWEFQGQGGWGSGQHHWVVGKPIHIMGLGTKWSLMSLSIQAILQFYDSVYPLQVCWLHQAMCAHCTRLYWREPLQDWEVGPSKSHSVQEQVQGHAPGNPKHTYTLGKEKIKSSPVEKGLRILVDENFNMC